MYPSLYQIAVCILLFLTIISHSRPAVAEPARPKIIFGNFSRIFEPSGIEQTDAITLIIEDEKDRPLHSVIDVGGELKLETQSLPDCGLQLNDLEGIATHKHNFYLLGSHHPKDDGKRRKKRELFIRLNITHNSCEVTKSPHSLYKGIQTILSETLAESTRPHRINLEALAWKHRTEQLFIGLREPLAGKKSIIITLKNPLKIFDQKETPQFAKEVTLLPLGGGGIRAISYIKNLNGYLIANETTRSNQKMRSNLWFWSGNSDLPQLISLPTISKLKNIEGITSFKHEGRNYIFFGL